MVLFSTVGITALRADDDIVRSLGLEPQAVQAICRNLAGADSLTNCSINMSDAKVKVCVFKDGSTDEVVFMDKPGPMPVMFTSSDGKGHVVASHFSQSVDPNKLVPVAAKGCGDNMVMWFQPTQDFVMSMPDDLGKDLERVLDVEVRIETKDGKTRVRQRQKNADGTTMEKDIELNDFDLKDFDPNILMLNKITDPKFTKTIVDSMMRNFDYDIMTDNNYGSLSDTDSFSVRKRIVIRMNNSETSIEHNACTPSVQRFEFLSSPNISSRVIILSRGPKRPVVPNVPQPLEHASLQETRTSQGAVAGSMLFPNPTTDGGATLSFSLTAARTLNLSLLNLNGEKLMDLASNVYRTAGDGQLAFALNNTAPGMYLVVLETDQGERVVQRLIVQ
ncbi:MAG: T9SS C-terminal target domain-containing protein [Ignavibacteriae bacterium]|nr:MAG: T9SS C-terminal target domain-containing protein [Ignavibacteriota bacterium]